MSTEARVWWLLFELVCIVAAIPIGTLIGLAIFRLLDRQWHL